MVLAFIKWRTLEAVLWFSNEELAKRVHCVSDGFDQSHFVSQRHVCDAEERLGPPIDESVRLPFDELQWAGKGGRIVASALPLRDGDRREIAGLQWICLTLADDVMELFHKADPDAHRYRDIFIDRDQCLAEWLPDRRVVANEVVPEAKGSAKGRLPEDSPERRQQAVENFKSGAARSFTQAAKMAADLSLGGKAYENQVDRLRKHVAARSSKKSD
jgi:hypothetical protein